MMELDQKALEAARDAAGRAAVNGEPGIPAAIAAYLSSIASLPSDDEVGRVCERLLAVSRQGQYVAPETVRAWCDPQDAATAAALIQSQAAELAAEKAEMVKLSQSWERQWLAERDLKCQAIAAQRRAEAALAEKGKALEWRGIESAPKDGTRILAYTTDAQHPAVHETWWFDGFWRHYNKDAEKFYPSGVHGWFPDRWMPIPAARRAHSKDGGEHV